MYQHMHKHENSIKIVDKTNDKTVSIHKKGSSFLFCPLQNKSLSKQKQTKQKTMLDTQLSKSRAGGQGH